MKTYWLLGSKPESTIRKRVDGSDLNFIETDSTGISTPDPQSPSKPNSTLMSNSIETNSTKLSVSSFKDSERGFSFEHHIKRRESSYHELYMKMVLWIEYSP